MILLICGRHFLTKMICILILLYLVYGAYLWFQLFSHTNLYTNEGDYVAKSTIYSPRTHRFRPRKNKDVESPGRTSVLTGTVVVESESQETPEVELEIPQMSTWMSFCSFGIIAVVSYRYTLAYPSH